MSKVLASSEQEYNDDCKVGDLVLWAVMMGLGTVKVGTCGVLSRTGVTISP